MKSDVKLYHVIILTDCRETKKKKKKHIGGSGETRILCLKRQITK